ncbi:MAG TPA: hypothetical protein PLB91_15195 [Spirochaetales bacterium]|nr:hypothetical protein [Spirochaetales bacterium]HRY55043.1 hypothetical protein [Spirochaetia bacterium]HRZ64360.1 hypothetical protein [Spirochaetia bacterium]
MRTRLPVALALLLAAASASAYPVYYKEQFYKLFHTHYIQYPDDAIENIYWLEQAKKANFCNPLYALATIEDKRDWERYRYLFDMHLNLKLIEQHLRLGSKFDKRVAYFYNAPWRDENLDSLKTAESAYRAALLYWDETVALAGKAMGMRFVELDEVQAWVDEAYRIVEGELDYALIIGDELRRLEKVRTDFEKMDLSTY